MAKSGKDAKRIRRGSKGEGGAGAKGIGIKFLKDSILGISRWTACVHAYPMRPCSYAGFTGCAG